MVLVLTFGTGIGSGLFVDGMLVPNTELGHLEVDGHDAEHQAAGGGPRPRGPVVEGVGQAGRALPAGRSSTLFSPDLIIVGGGASRKAEKWLPHIDVGTEIVPAALTNEAGIVGAAILVAADGPVESRPTRPGHGAWRSPNCSVAARIGR